MEIQCTHCQAKLKVMIVHKGIKCPKCGKPVEATKPTGAVTPKPTPTGDKPSAPVEKSPPA